MSNIGKIKFVILLLLGGLLSSLAFDHIEVVTKMPRSGLVWKMVVPEAWNVVVKPNERLSLKRENDNTITLALLLMPTVSEVNFTIEKIKNAYISAVTNDMQGVSVIARENVVMGPWSGERIDLRLSSKLHYSWKAFFLTHGHFIFFWTFFSNKDPLVEEQAQGIIQTIEILSPQISILENGKKSLNIQTAWAGKWYLELPEMVSFSHGKAVFSVALDSKKDLRIIFSESKTVKEAQEYYRKSLNDFISQANSKQLPIKKQRLKAQNTVMMEQFTPGKHSVILLSQIGKNVIKATCTSRNLTPQDIEVIQEIVASCQKLKGGYYSLEMDRKPSQVFTIEYPW